MALDIEDPRTYPENEEPCRCVYPDKCFCSQIEPWPSETFQMLDDLDLERLCIDAGEELLRRYGVRLEKLAQAMGEVL